MDPDGDYESLHSSRSIGGALLKEAKQDDTNEFDGKGKDEEMGLKTNYSTTVLSEEKAGSIDLKPSAPPAVDLGCLPSAPPFESSLHPLPEDDTTAPPTPESNHPPEPPGFKEDVNETGNCIPDSVALPIGLDNADRALPVASVVPIITDATGAEVAPTTEISPWTTNENIPTNQGTRDPARRVPSFFRQSSTHPAPLDKLPANHSAEATLADPQPPRARRDKDEGQGSRCTPCKKIMAIILAAVIISGVAVGLTTSSKPNEHNYPNCHVSHPEWIGDDFCNGGQYNTKQCSWDGGDCFEQNWPGCHVSHPEWIGDGFCNGGQYNTAECGWDGEDCFGRNWPRCQVGNPEWIGNGFCNGGQHNTEECGWDGGDCFVVDWPDCHIDDSIKLGDGNCDGSQYNTEECGWDGGDCVEGYPDCRVANPIKVGNGNCDGGEYYTEECGWDGGDCVEGYPDCRVANPIKVGNGNCDGGEYYTEECGWDGGDCVEGYPDCRVANPIKVGNGNCDGGEYNTEECGWDGGDCVEGYPDCRVANPIKVGNGNCDGGEYNTEECGWDGGDCIIPDWPNCHVDSPENLGNGRCNHHGGYNTAQCGFDDGDCGDISLAEIEEFLGKYPNCQVDAEYFSWIKDGTCCRNCGDLNNAECGWDGGDCLDFNSRYPDCHVDYAHWIGDGSCDGGDCNTAECGYDGGDFVQFNREERYPNCDTKSMQEYASNERRLLRLVLSRKYTSV